MKILTKALKYLFIAVTIIIIFPYLLCPLYEYPEVSPFTGKLYYNPYENINKNTWLKANFHSHTRQWSGITAGSSSDEKTVAARYKELKYDITGISDYQDINYYLGNEPLFIPVYEHGYGVLKSHQLVIGASNVSWKDYLLFQTFHNLQDVIASLKKDGEVISVNHPRLRGAYSTEDLKYLKGYDLLEVTSHSYFNATDLWDTALSAGNPVFALGSDDNHDINDPEDFGYVFTMINCSERSPASVISSLKLGKSFAVELEPQKDTSPQKKIEQAATIPLLLSCSIKNDTIEFTFERDFEILKLIGQNGTTKVTVYNSDSVKYAIKPEDNYIRAELSQNGYSNVFLNPVFRYDGEFNRKKPEIDLIKTWIYRFVLLITGVFTVSFALKKKLKKNSAKN